MGCYKFLLTDNHYQPLLLSGEPIDMSCSNELKLSLFSGLSP